MQKYSLFLVLITLTYGTNMYTVNMVVKPESIQPPPHTLPAPLIAPMPAPPAPPNALPPTEKTLTIINTTPFPMNIRFETNSNPGVIDTIPAHNSKRINYKLNSLVMYSFEELKSQPITPNMIAQDVATITTPPELLPKPAVSQPAPIAQASAPLAPVVAQPIISTPPASANTTFVTSQLPASASSQGPPGFKAERPR